MNSCNPITSSVDEVVGRTVRAIDECSVSFVVLYMSGVDGLEKDENDKESLPVSVVQYCQYYLV